MKNEKRLITAALTYVNNIPHVGHIVGCHLPADIFARFCRSYGYDTTFVGGSDMHGTPSLVTAQELNLPVEELTEILEKIELYNKIYEGIVNQERLFEKITDYIETKIKEEIMKRSYPSYPTYPQPMPIFYEQNPYRPAHEVWCDTKTTLKDEISTTHTADTKTTNKLPGLPQYGSKLGE